MTDRQLPIALTMGEPAGIGGELSIMIWRRHRREISPFFLIDDASRLQGLSESIGERVDVGVISEPEEARHMFPDRLPVLALPLAAPVVPGQLNGKNSPAVMASIEMAVQLVRAGRAGAVVTNPIHKQALYKAGFAHPGHTEFLAALAEVKSEPIMMLASDRLRVVTVTRHLSLAGALERLSQALIVETVETVHVALCRDFAIPAPRIAVSALNPHGGEAGTMGQEEIDLIQPAIERLRKNGVKVSGPHPADTLFHPRARARYDAAVCMYHDQALIPIKTIDFDGAVNITLGLPFIRTSPDHGTALDIAGTGTANEGSLLAALTAASVMSANRARGLPE
ncbi:MAG: 4-hydroxythreonine-4-phosphate dehydrogenase PdxA [Rhodospirillales bacterium]|jgi:4-hydroxythreonine-4-phosphate dehydrogenase|nr:4-hydroxythreonine-4-phosphate dehydrogenase PdxA [Rhodospirillaceae bacterium]MDP6426816.1 4-hydroxythreonine-4-phosphate dehydrogenase PdxA [Rhodospirillales bacterium]MDP6643404.1 4-hydroxythreonine-4-phosphate dehydrogenase PdxA [Rhodospirillales bacterium]MDP6842232.1 4-hydroxythreonine-4-phosphate dehydrogenase PdxA [Rhodospirillales bacterium]|tara:strand:+ start:1980 stop:2996 length:1017 start_codon:yes stop_codon:yes gene_type:complete